VPATKKWESERERNQSRKRGETRNLRDVLIPPCDNPIRRAALEADDIAWLMHYFGPDSGSESPFTYEFTFQQREMITAIRNAILDGGDQSLAASRGEGKTTLFERMLLKNTLTGAISFAVLFAATGSGAQDSLESIKWELENNDALLPDYPEVCVPIRALENTPNRAHYQTVSGLRHDDGQPYSEAPSKFSWCGQEIYLPKVPGSPSAGAIIATRGLDSAVRGLKKKGRRVNVAGIDDPDTEETVRSEEQAKKLEDRIDRAIAGLGGQKRRVARVMLTSLQNRTCVSYKFTDPSLKPSWNGKRFRFLVKPPKRADLWEEYVDLKGIDWQQDTQAAHEFYVANREAMDDGAEVANPNRYTRGELSALQFYYNEVARIGHDAVATEYDNDPPETGGPVESGIKPTVIQRRLSGFHRRIVPPACTVLTRGIDVRKRELHYVVKAWEPDATNYVVDYDVFNVLGTTYASDEGLERAIHDALLALFEQSQEYPCMRMDGEIVPFDLTLIDSGYQAPAIYDACRALGMSVFAAKGHGKTNGCVTLSFSEASKRTIDRRPGDGWFQARHREPLKSDVWVTHCDTDRWKGFEHARWMTADGKPGAAYLFGEMTADEEKVLATRIPREGRAHLDYASQICSELEVEEMVKGVLKRYWKPSTKNHFLDASYLADVAASLKGIRLLTDSKKSQSSGNRPTLAELAGKK
jgi:hypothetical protein